MFKPAHMYCHVMGDASLALALAGKVPHVGAWRVTERHVIDASVRGKH